MRSHDSAEVTEFWEEHQTGPVSLSGHLTGQTAHYGLLLLILTSAAWYGWRLPGLCTVSLFIPVCN